MYELVVKIGDKESRMAVSQDKHFNIELDFKGDLGVECYRSFKVGEDEKVTFVYRETNLIPKI